MKLKNTDRKFDKQTCKTSLKYLTAVVASLCAISATQADVNSPVKKIGDLEIYKPASGGMATVTMMLDISGSMGPSSIPEDYKESLTRNPGELRLQSYTICRYTNRTTTPVQTMTRTEKMVDSSGVQYDTISYTLTGCPTTNGGRINVDANGKTVGYFDRISRLKLALIPLFANGTRLPDNYKIGIGTYSFLSSGRLGVITVPAKPLTKEHRRLIVDNISKIRVFGGTPSAHAYAEAGAYMMGTLTSNLGPTQTTRYIQKGYGYSNWPWWYFSTCLIGLNGTFNVGGQTWYGCQYTPLPASSQVSYHDLDKFDTSLIGSPKDRLLVRPSRDSPPTGVYYGDKKTAYWAVDENSGFPFSDDSTKTEDLKTYKSPIVDGQCDGYGIYFLTDGEPNNSSYDKANALMTKSLNLTTNFPKKNLRSGSDCAGDLYSSVDGAWNCMGEYAKRLRSGNNPTGKSIKTAAVGFGSVFSSIDKNRRNIKVTDENGNLVNESIPDCSKVTADAKNLCQLAELKDQSGTLKTGGYGEGGFTATNDSQVLANSFQKFAASLVQTTNVAPSGVMTVPSDPYKVIGEMPYAFLPTVQSKLSTASNTSNIWPGNVKKYNLKNGTLAGKNGKNLFSSIVGGLDASVQDLWSATDFQNAGKPANDSVKAGGVYANLKSPNQGLDKVRSVWVEDTAIAGGVDTTFKQIKVDAAGKPIGFDALLDTTIYTRANQIKLLQFLGFEKATYNGRTKNLSSTDVNEDTWEKTTTVAIKDLTMVQPTSENKVLGATIHAKPLAVSYGADLDENGEVKADSRKDYIFFGSMDGALHLVGADDLSKNNGGEEKTAMITLAMMKNQVNALVPNSTYISDANRLAGVPNFGVDGHWLVKSDFKYDYDNSKVSTKSVYAYGGMRLGGKGLLALDISHPNSPKKLFSTKNTTLIDSSIAGFGRIGYIWNQPTYAKIRKTTNKDDKGTDVIIFGGGYDMCYEYENFQVGITDTTLGTCSNKAEAEGNAVYMVDAKTGQLLWSASSTTGDTRDTNLKNSIVGSVTALDRNNDGFTDHIYFGDLGGQVFRVDFKDGSTESTPRITRILKDNDADTAATKKYARRFYERPIVSIHRNTSDNRLFALINVISGDRSSPLSKMRNDNKYADRLYGIIDSDVTRVNSDFYPTNGTFSPIIKDLTIDNLAALPTAMDDTVPLAGYSQEVRDNAIGVMKNYIKKGWYYPLSLFDGFANVRYSKGMGRSDIFAGYLYTTVYNPDMTYGSTDACTAKIAGGSERQAYCLPYGICKDQLSHNGTAGFARAGQGIQELNFGPASKDQPNKRMLIGTLDFTERLKTTNRVNSGNDSDKRLIQVGTTTVGGSSMMGLDNSTGGQSQLTEARDKVGGSQTLNEIIVEPRYVLKPSTWYENN